MIKIIQVVVLIAAVWLIVTTLTSCNAGSDITGKSTGSYVDGISIRIYEIDGCQYIGWAVGTRHGLLTHKGNCRYCAERARTK